MTKLEVPPPGTVVRAVRNFGRYCVTGNHAYVVGRCTKEGKEHLTQMIHLTGIKRNETHLWHPTYFTAASGDERVWCLSTKKLTDAQRLMIVKARIKESTNV